VRQRTLLLCDIYDEGGPLVAKVGTVGPANPERKPFVPYDHMKKYKTLKELHNAKRTRVHVITLWDVLTRAFELGEEKAYAMQPQVSESDEVLANKIYEVVSESLGVNHNGHISIDIELDTKIAAIIAKHRQPSAAMQPAQPSDTMQPHAVDAEENVPSGCIHCKAVHLGCVIKAIDGKGFVCQKCFLRQNYKLPNGLSIECGDGRVSDRYFLVDSDSQTVASIDGFNNVHKIIELTRAPIHAAQPSADAVECAQPNNNPTKEKIMNTSERLDREVENHHIRQTYNVATKSLCPETWEKFCDALNELCERRGMDNSFMGGNAKPRTWELR